MSGEGAAASRSAFVPVLESARGWAVLLVVFFHYFGVMAGQFDPAGLSAWQRLIAAGNSGVTLFFVLSGFLLSRPVVAAFSTRRENVLRSFVVSRALRIIPLFYLVVIAAWLLSGNIQALKGLLFLPLGFSVFPYSVPWWSLSVEMQFYAFLGVLLLLARHGIGKLCAVLLLLAFLAWHLCLVSGEIVARMGAWHNSFPGRFPAFVFGALAAFVYDRSSNMPSASRQRFLYGMAFCFSLSCLLVLFYWYGGQQQESVIRIFPAFHDVEALLWAVLLLSLLQLNGSWKGVFVNRLMNYLGEISYSVYLLHVPIIFFMLYPHVAGGVVGPHAPWFVVGSALVILLASTLSWRFIEKPFLALKVRLMR